MKKTIKVKPHLYKTIKEYVDTLTMADDLLHKHPEIIGIDHSKITFGFDFAPNTSMVFIQTLNLDKKMSNIVKD